MGNKAAAPKPIPTSFVYEELVAHVQQMQVQLKSSIELLRNRWESQKQNSREIKLRSFMFIDPFGNRTTHKYMDHEYLGDICRKYKQEYIPKYLQQSIEIGIIDGDSISALNEKSLRSMISQYGNDTVFCTYVNMNVWIGKGSMWVCDITSIRVLPFSSWERIKTELKNSQKCHDIELRLFTSDQIMEEHKLIWADGTTLKSDETFMSHKLYEKHHALMAKMIEENVSIYIITFSLI